MVSAESLLTCPPLAYFAGPVPITAQIKLLFARDHALLR
jgi:hypothetical protein